MTNWELKKLSDVCEVIMGQSPPGNTYNKNGTGLPFFQGKTDFGSFYPTPSTWCSKPKKIAESNDILISVRAPVGPTNMCAHILAFLYDSYFKFFKSMQIIITIDHTRNGCTKQKI